MAPTIVAGTIRSLFYLALLVTAPPVHPASNTPAPAPDVSLQAVPAVADGPPNQTFVVLITMTNKGAVPLKQATIELDSPDFNLQTIEPLPNPLSPYATAVVRAGIVAATDVQPALSVHNVLFAARYSWNDGNRDVQSAQTATTALTLKPPFADQAQGLPGGTVALLYLLLPVIPAFLSYRIVEQARLQQPLQIPSFRAEDIPFAFIVAITFGAGRLLYSGANGNPDYAQPLTLMVTVVISALGGAAVPLGKMGLASYHNKKWRITPQDDGVTYLRKALFGPEAPATFDWVSGRVNQDQWTGLLLHQPDGSPVLGARVQVSPDPNAPAPERQRVWQLLTAQAVRADGTVLNGQKLLKMLEAGELTVAIVDQVRRANQPQDTFAVADNLKPFRVQTSERRALVTAFE